MQSDVEETVSGRNLIARELRSLLRVRRILRQLRRPLAEQANAVMTPMGPMSRKLLIDVTEGLFLLAVKRVCLARKRYFHRMKGASACRI
jgi:hypothetical protein